MRKRILVLDFDGVIHSYTSGWQGARVIPDPPVPRAIDFLLRALVEFDVAILSSRSHQWGGRRAMKGWLRMQLAEWIEQKWPDGETYGAVGPIPFFSPGMEPWDVEVAEWANCIVRMIRWPLFKPAAHVTIDDRAITFNGEWPFLQEIVDFRPWNKREA